MKLSKAESIKIPHPEAKPSSYFVQFLNLHFFLLPFRIEREPESAEYRFPSKPTKLKVLERYKKLNDVTSTTKEVFGSFVMCYYICILPFFAEMPQILLSNSHVWIRLAMVFYMVLVSSSLGLAAHGHAQAHKSLQKAIFFHHSDKRTSTTERLQLIALTQEIEIQPIGISCQFFTITTKFLSSTFGLFITYSIIIFQMSTNEKVFWEN
ncbi:unnamed protein product [Orchesella dallaii]|uniref:Uncharacterized protein n=1 Tax=Orchesella dallaii TaxID=48710 RepID=A0ABP1S3M7_9HEXA